VKVSPQLFGERPDPARTVLFVFGLLGVGGFLGACMGLAVGFLSGTGFVAISGLALSLYVASLAVAPDDGTDRPSASGSCAAG